MAVHSVVVKVMAILQTIFSFVLKIPVLGRYLDICLCSVAIIVRFSKGAWVAPGVDKSNRPRKTLILYQYEACPYCRLVREAFSVLALDYINYPCPRVTLAEYGVVGDSRYRPQALKLSSKAQFPVLVDPNYEPPLVVTESADIVAHLWHNYGNAATMPLHCKLADSSQLLLLLPSLLRPLPEHGLIQMPSKLPKEMLELYQFEVSPFCKLVREKLDSMAIPYLVRNLPKGFSSGRRAFAAKYSSKLSSFRKTVGLVMVPLLVDPNTDTHMVESEDILGYLEEQYALEGEGGAAVSWSDYSTRGATASHGTLPGTSSNKSKDQ